jgi:hypothetical protein
MMGPWDRSSTPDEYMVSELGDVPTPCGAAEQSHCVCNCTCCRGAKCMSVQSDARQTAHGWQQRWMQRAKGAAETQGVSMCCWAPCCKSCCTYNQSSPILSKATVIA